MTVMTVADHLAGKAQPATDDGGTLADALHDTRAFIHRYVRLSEEQTTLIAIWIAMTHALDAFDFVAYLHITSPLPECGKTRLLEVLAPLVANPWFTSRVSAAVLMRKVDREHPTLLLDESDAAFNGHDEQYSEALRGLLNAGFQREGKASVCVGQGANLQPKDFSVFGPKAIAGIGQLPATVESRSIPVVMKRRLKDEIVHKWRHRHGHAAATPVRERLAAVMARHVEALKGASPEIPTGFSDRAEDVIEPLLAIADVAGGEWPQVVRTAALLLMGASRTSREASQHLVLGLLTDIRQILDAHAEQHAFHTEALLIDLIAEAHRPWATLGKNNQPMTANKLAWLLKRLDILPAGQLWIDGKNRNGYRRVAFDDAFARYLGIEPLDPYNANNDKPKSAKPDSLGTDDLEDRKPAKPPDKNWGSSALEVQNRDGEDDDLV